MNTSLSRHTAWKHVGRAQHRKLCNKLYADTCFYEIIFMRTHPCKSKSCVEGRLFTVNMHRCPSRGSNHCFSDKTLYVKNCILRRVRKLSHAAVHRFDLSPSQSFASVKPMFSDMISYVKSCTWKRFVSYVVWLYIDWIMTNMLTYVKSYAQTCLRKLKSSDVVLCFDCTCGKLYNKQGVICLNLCIDMIS